RRHPYSRTYLVAAPPVRSVEATVETTIDVVAIAPITVHRAVTHAGHANAVREAAGIGRLHERHTGNRRGYNRPKNIPHEDTSSGGNSLAKRPGEGKKSHMIHREQRHQRLIYSPA